MGVVYLRQDPEAGVGLTDGTYRVRSCSAGDPDTGTSQDGSYVVDGTWEGGRVA